MRLPSPSSASPGDSRCDAHAWPPFPSFSGDNINGYHPSERTPDPERLLSAYFHSATTLNYIRALLASDFASLTAPRSWSFSHVRSPVLQAQFEDVISRLTDSLDFMTTIGAPLPSTAQGVEIFTSHEGLSLEFEETQTRHLPRPETDEERSARLNKGHSINPERSSTRAGRRGQSLTSSVSSLNGTPPAPPPCAYYNTGSHYLWIGDRTRQVEGGHVEYFRGLENPVGVKVGPTMPKGELTRLLASASDRHLLLLQAKTPSIADPRALCAVLDPNREPGKVSLICRYGAGKIEDFLANHIDEVEASGHRVVWVCDPMHGNTKTAENSTLKTRAFGDIIHEVTASMRIVRCSARLTSRCDATLTGSFCSFSTLSAVRSSAASTLS